MLNGLLVTVGLILLTPMRLAWAQDGFAQNASDVGERSGHPSDSTEAINAGRGSFLGFGGQKPLNRVGGIPLPTRQTRSAAAGFPSPQGSAREYMPVASRRSKPTMTGDLTTDFPARMIYLNGKNISSVRQQQLDGVNVRIDSNGNVHISAPHYEVQESSHYRPLLPHDVPKVGKPSVAADAPLLQGRYSKPAAPTESDMALQRNAVPPIAPEGETVEKGNESASEAAPTDAKAEQKETIPPADTGKSTGQGI